MLHDVKCAVVSSSLRTTALLRVRCSTHFCCPKPRSHCKKSSSRTGIHVVWTSHYDQCTRPWYLTPLAETAVTTTGNKFHIKSVTVRSERREWATSSLQWYCINDVRITSRIIAMRARLKVHPYHRTERTWTRPILAISVQFSRGDVNEVLTLLTACHIVSMYRVLY